ncbi:hypothetical protein COL154_003038 [Colletotrichum chrysophilum]|nr:hypothetical protein KNSL1_007821 [Colletotrichum chrysophilum]KAJ0367816.1 hypothetical protein COL154_003038 [Colletotrichum chrysophilum]
MILGDINGWVMTKSQPSPRTPPPAWKANSNFDSTPVSTSQEDATSIPRSTPVEVSGKQNPLVYSPSHHPGHHRLTSPPSAGLKPTGGGRSGCDKGGNGQVYARRGTSQDRTGIMYSYYVPKVRWGKGNDEGHRHYWASIVVWINRWGCDAEDVTSVWPVGLSFTADHATWQTASAGVTTYEASGVGLDTPTRPRMQIHDNAITPFGNGDASKAFGRTLVGWDSLPAAAQKALGDVKYEHTEVPFIDANFQKYMDAAYRESFYGGLKEDQGCVGGGKTPTTEAPSSTTTAPAIDDPLR